MPEICAFMASLPRGTELVDALAGKVVEEGEHLVVAAKTLTQAVASRFEKEERVSQRVVAEAGTARLGMRHTRPRWRGKNKRRRRRLWAFPQQTLAARMPQRPDGGAEGEVIPALRLVKQPGPGSKR